MAHAAKPASATMEFTFQIDGLTHVDWKRGIGVSFTFNSAAKASAFPKKLSEFAFLIDAFCKAEVTSSRVYTILLKKTDIVGLQNFDIDEIIISVAKFHTPEKDVAPLKINFDVSPFYQGRA
jgi:hypothetical protein